MSAWPKRRATAFRRCTSTRPRKARKRILRWPARCSAATKRRARQHPKTQWVSPMAKLKGLGRGLDALLSGSDEATGGDALKSLSIDRIRSGRYQPRTRMDEASLAELTDSIKAQGVVQPILVRPVDGGRYEIVAGERRGRAAARGGIQEVPALIPAR